MKRKIYFNLCFISTTAILISAVLTLYAFYGFFSEEVKNQLKSESVILAKNMEFNRQFDGQYIDSIGYREEGLRITLIKSDGTVSYDTIADAQTMVNHNDRPEVIMARQKGMGTDIRKSDTVGKDLYYYSILLTDGSVLRLSKETNNITAVFLNIFPVIIGILIFVLIISFWVSGLLTKNLLKPLLTTASDVDVFPIADDPENNRDYYEELTPFFQKIRKQNEQIKQYIDKLKQERDTIKTITENMKEGLVIIDRDRNILSLNKSAVNLLGAMDGIHYTGINIMALYRNIDFAKHAKKAVLEGTSSDLLIPLDERSCRIFINPVYDDNQSISGAVILILDVTQQLKAEQVRRDFSANVSHELKTPLTSINGFAQMIENGMASDPLDIKKFAGLICKEANRLISIINDIIRLSEIEETHGKSEFINLNLLNMAYDVVNSIKFVAQEKNVSLEVTGENVMIHGNPRMIEELLFNLVDNGVKYNKPGGHVKIDIASNEILAVVTVSDTGIGISPEHQDRIFERFYRVDKSRSRENGATGLGLSIVKHIVEYHAGSIALKSELNEGTSITVSLPKKI